MAILFSLLVIGFLGAIFGIVRFFLGSNHLPAGWHKAPVYPYTFAAVPEATLGLIYAQTGKWGTARDIAAERMFMLAELEQLRDELAKRDEGVSETPIGEEISDHFTVVFKPEEPTSFEQFEGQPHIIRPLAAMVKALDIPRRVGSHALFTGLPGRGKTLLAKVVAAELQRRAYSLSLPPVAYVETFAANLTSVKDIDDTARALLEAGGGVWFIDEIHVLPHDVSTKIFALMEDGKYPFHGSVTPAQMPEIMVIGATTDYGKLHPALKRRFGEPYMVRPMSKQALQRVIEQMPFPIVPEAVELLLSRTHWSGAPWEAKVLFGKCVDFAKAAGRDAITAADVQEVFDTYQIDELGLRWIDREVLRALFQRPRYRGKHQEFVCYGASENDVCAVAGLDPEEYRESIKPRLMSRQLLEVRSGYGQALTSRAMELYAELKPST